MKYDAFISYSHAEDRSLAAALQSALARFAKRWYRPRALRVFRDSSSLAATPGLWSAITTALGEARRFVLLASPTSAASPWVAKEVAWWLEHRSADEMFIVLTKGRLQWNSVSRDFDWSQTDALPKLLSGRFSEEPLYVDLSWCRSEDEQTIRHSRFRRAVLNLAAPLHGISKDELDSEEIRQNRRVRTLAASAVALLVVLAIGASIAAVVAVQQQRTAVAQRERADEQRDIAIARDLVAQARLAEASGRPERALLLAAEAVAARSPVEAGTEQALRDLLASIGGKPVPAAQRDDRTGEQPNPSRWRVADSRLLDGTRPDHPGYRLTAADQTIREHRFSPDGDHLVVALSNDRWTSFTLVPGQAPIERTLSVPDGQRFDHFTTFSPRGDWLLSWDRDIVLWPLPPAPGDAAPADADTDNPGDDAIDPVVVPDRWVRWVKFNPAGDSFVTSGYEAPRLYGLSDDIEELRVFEGIANERTEFSEDGRWLFLPPHLYRYGDALAETPLTLEWPERQRPAVGPTWRFLRGGQWLLHEDDRLRLWHTEDSIASPEPAFTLTRRYDVSGDDRWLLAYAFDDDQSTNLIDLRDGVRRVLGGPPLVGATFAPDHGAAVLVRRNGDVDVLDPDRPDAPQRLGTVLGARGVEYSARGRWVLVRGHYDQVLFATDPDTPRRLEIAAGQTTFAPDDNWLIVGTNDRTLRKYDLRENTGASVDETLRGHEDRVAARFEDEGARLFTRAGDIEREWNLARPSNAASPLVLDCKGSADQATFSPDGRWIAAHCANHRLAVWRLDGNLLAAFDTTRDVTASTETVATANLTGAPFFSDDGR